MKHIPRTIRQIILTLGIALFTLVPGYSAEIDDSTVFIDAFNAFQQNDFLLAIEKCDLLNQVFPDSPLRDVTLLLVARASLKSGDNERAAKSMAQFTSEYPESSLRTSIEEELKVLASRRQNGEVLAVDIRLQNAARKVSSDRLDRLARERAELKRQMKSAAEAKTEQERLARIKLEEEIREKGRALVKESIKVDQIRPDNRAEINLD